MEIMEIINWITWIVTAASAIAESTPTPKDDALIGKIYRAIDVLAINFGKAKMQAPSAPNAESK